MIWGLTCWMDLVRLLDRKSVVCYDAIHGFKVCTFQRFRLGSLGIHLHHKTTIIDLICSSCRPCPVKLILPRRKKRFAFNGSNRIPFRRKTNCRWSVEMRCVGVATIPISFILAASEIHLLRWPTLRHGPSPLRSYLSRND